MEPRRRFRFLKELAAGGFGKVYLAEMLSGDGFSSVVAIKLLHGKWLGNDEIVMRSRDEARLLGRLRHRNIVRVEDLTSINGQCAIVMEYLHGVDMKTACMWLREKGRPFPRRAAFEVIAAVADALDAAYNARPLQGGDPLRVIHRDIKPSNVMVTVEGDVKVLDFGTARASFEEREAKTQALAFGSAAYMAPERHMGEDDTVAGDIFSLGVTAYEVLALEGFGKIHVRPERYERQLDERMAVLDLRELDPGVRQDVMELLRAMLAYDGNARPTAAAVRERMEALVEATRDLALRRFAREHLAMIADGAGSPLDPADNIGGDLVHEDVSGLGGNETASTSRTWSDDGPSSASAVLSVGDPMSIPEAAGVPRPPPMPPGMATLRPSIAPPGSPLRAESSRPDHPRPDLSQLGVAASPGGGAVAAHPAAPARPAPVSRPAAPTPLGPAPTLVGIELPPTGTPRVAPPALAPDSPDLPLRTATPPISVSRSRPPPPPGPHDDASSFATQRPPQPVAVAVAADVFADPDPEPRPAGSRWLVRIAVAALLLIVLGVVGAAVAWVVYAPAPTGVPVVDEPRATPDRTLPDGAATAEWAPVAPGRSGALLTVPAGAVEVTVTNSADYRGEWSGKGVFALRDVLPGVYRTKVKLPGDAPALRADFTLAPDRACALAFVVSGDDGAWVEGECR